MLNIQGNSIGACPDWVWSEESNVHVSTHIAWFRTYTRFDSTVYSRNGHSYPVLGIGSVCLLVRRSANATGTNAYNTWQLQDVLHVPSAPCNTVGGPLPGFSVQFGLSLGYQTTAIIDQETGQSFAFFEPGYEHLCKLKIKSRQWGHTHLAQSRLNPRSTYDFTLLWPDRLRAVWEEAQTIAVPAAKPETRPETEPTKPTKPTEPAWGTLLACGEEQRIKEEMVWARKYFETGHNFFQKHDLSAIRDEDIQEARKNLWTEITSGCMNDSETDESTALSSTSDKDKRSVSENTSATSFHVDAGEDHTRQLFVYEEEHRPHGDENDDPNEVARINESDKMVKKRLVDYMSEDEEDLFEGEEDSNLMDLSPAADGRWTSTQTTPWVQPLSLLD